MMIIRTPITSMVAFLLWMCLCSCRFVKVRMDVVELEVRPRSGGSMHGIEGVLGECGNLGFEDWI